MLQRIGLTERQEELYRATLEEPQIQRQRLAARLNLSEGEVDHDLQALVTAGLILPGALGGEEFIVSDPQAAIGALIHREQRRLDELKLESSRFAEQLRRMRQQNDVATIIEVVIGGDEIEARWQQAQQAARSRVRMTDRPPYYAGAKIEGMDTQLQRMADGIHYQVLYDAQLLDEAYHLHRLQAAVDAGEEARTAADVPIKLIIIDEDLGFLVLLSSGTQTAPTVIVVHRSALLDSLIELFNLLWRNGQPFTTASQIAGDVDEQRRQLIALLAAGLKDEAIGLELGVTARTVRRWIKELYSDLGVRNRFQAGVAAARRGWL